MMIIRVSIFAILFLLFTTHFARSRSIKYETNLISDGLELDLKIETSYVRWSLNSDMQACVWVLAMHNSDMGSDFFDIGIWVRTCFGLEIYSYISTESDIFFKLTGPGIFGASLFNLLPTIPQMTLLLGKSLQFSKQIFNILVV